MLKEFKDFIAKGNVLDLAVAVIIGGAFGAIVKSLTDDIIMPLIGLILGGVNFAGLSFQVGNAVVAYGNFIQAIINFLLIAFVLFMIVRSFNKMNERKAKEVAAAPPPAPSDEVVLLREIRDLLRR